ncbi:hypothetical protein [Francisella philomiragia]|uniref:hypothetical protein n=1 Tax=Francisella philomiragia TaxID=28110 RepID=UPI00351400B0
MSPVTLETLENENNKQNKECGTLSTILMTPISAIGIGVGAVELPKSTAKSLISDAKTNCHII